MPIGKGPGHGRHYHVADNHNGFFLIVRDSTKHYTLHAVVERDEDMKTYFEQIIGVPIKYEMLTCNPWRQNLLLAEGYQDGRVFLAGDAVHLVIPTGGLGMNTGVGDAIDLSWKLAATLQGWGGPNLFALLRGRAASDRRAQCRRLALRDVEWPQMAGYGGGPTSKTTRRRARRCAPGNFTCHRCRAAQEQRDDRRRARLSLCRFANHLRHSRQP